MRTEKKKDPKLAAAESDHAAYKVMERLIQKFHDHLSEAKIALVWILEPRLKKGKLNLGTARCVPELWHRLCGLDAVIELDFEFWKNASDDARSYLLDHELCHLTPVYGEDGEIKDDTTGRGSYKTVPHDVEEFAGPIKRWGMKNADLRRFVVETDGQLSLLTMDEMVEQADRVAAPAHEALDALLAADSEAN